MDMPSGLDADSGLPANECVEADATATLGFAKIGLLADSATRFVGRLAVVPLPALTAPRADPARVAETSWLPSVFPPRSFDLHKGNCGRIGLVVGSPGFTGAAHLASLGALHAGGGLITVFADPHISECLATRCPAEVMVRPIADLRGVLQEKLDVLAIGPGLGLSKKNQILTILRNARIPVVVDADALNALSENPGLIKNAPAPRLLTPHPGEMQRLLPQQKLTRREWACTLSEALQCTVLLKGARTVIASPKEPPIFNTTGNPGMAGGGMGDVLTGVCAALIGQNPKQPVHHLAALAAWLCGCAAEQALLLKDCSPESLKATDVATQLGSAFRALRQRTY
jgi:NAD(P)H-hydrate epimerase